MFSCLVAIIVAAPTQAPTDEHHPDAIEIFREDFESASDVDFDGWPDRWQRRTGTRFPHYVHVGIASAPEDRDRSCLAVVLDGGAAALGTGLLPILSEYDYVLEARMRASQLVLDRAWIQVDFFDEAQRRIESHAFSPVTGSTPWIPVHLGPLACPAAGRFVEISLHVEPTGQREDLQGGAYFDDVWLGKVPRLSLALEPGRFVIEEGEQLELVCRTSGEVTPGTHIRYTLLDAQGRSLDEADLPLAADQELLPLEGGASAALASQTSSARWRPRLPAPGFYRVEARMHGHAGPIHVRTVTIAVIENWPTRSDGEFGWSMQRGEGGLALSELARLASLSGIHWMKFPLWHGEESRDRVDDLMWFSDRLSSLGIEIVGILADPPPAIRDRLEITGPVVAANLFTRDPMTWYPPAESVMSRLSLKVRWWQLGRDDDTSFIGYGPIVEKLAAVKDHLDKIGQDVQLGFAWSWVDESPSGDEPLPWRFLSRTEQPPLTAAELVDYLADAPSGVVRQWVTVESLAEDSYSIESRAADLVRRMVSAKVAGASAIYYGEPIADQAGLLNLDGSPGELLLPWRTTAWNLSGAQYLGRLTLPEGSENECFYRNGEVVAVVWADTPRRETIFLGDGISQIDVWGRTTQPRRASAAHEIEVGPVPTFLVGASEALVRWQMSPRFSQERIPSAQGVPHPNSLLVTNHYPQGVNARIRIVTPAGWHVSPELIDLKLGPGDQWEQALEIVLPPGASTGLQPVRLEVSLMAERQIDFSLTRVIEVGLGDLILSATTRLNERGELEVEQRITSHSELPAAFRCSLSIPNRRRLRMQVFGVADGDDVRVYRVENGKELLGKQLSLRAEEIGGNRVLNYTFVAEP